LGILLQTQVNEEACGVGVQERQMRLTKQQMRAIRDLNIKRADWAGKDLTVWHEHYGRVIFGKGNKNELSNVRSRARTTHNAVDFRQVGALRYD
jgi:hypothetical protein